MLAVPVAVQDPDVTTKFLGELNSQLLDVESVSYITAVELPCVAAKL